jgi:hypothetical protein
MTQTAQPLLGIGTTLSIGTQGGGSTFVVIGYIKKITPPAGKWGWEDTTTLNTPGVDKIGNKTLRDPGEVSIEGLYESADAGQIALQAAFNVGSNTTNGDKFPFKLALPVNLPGGEITTGELFAFNAAVTEWAISDVEDEKDITFKASLKVSGPTTPTAGA